MRLVLAFSGFLAAVACAAGDARGTLLSTLTGRVDDAAAADEVTASSRTSRRPPPKATQKTCPR